MSKRLGVVVGCDTFYLCAIDVNTPTFTATLMMMPIPPNDLIRNLLKLLEVRARFFYRAMQVHTHSFAISVLVTLCVAEWSWLSHILPLSVSVQTKNYPDDNNVFNKSRTSGPRSVRAVHQEGIVYTVYSSDKSHFCCRTQRRESA